MSALSLPADGSYLELTSAGHTLPQVRVVRTNGTMIMLSLALDDVPPAESQVTLRWSAAPRGRHVAAANVASVDGNRIEVQLSGEPVIEQLRHFVRGGGGEPIVVVQHGLESSVGFVHDLSEQSVRAHFSDIEVAAGDELIIRLQLGDDVLERRAMATAVSSMRQQLPRRGPMSVELVAVFADRDDVNSQTIRRYVLRNQLLARSRSALA